MIITATDVQQFKQKALTWASAFDAFCYLDSNNFEDRYSKFDTLIAIGAKNYVIADAGNAFSQLAAFRGRCTGWITGFLGYDLKNETENLISSNNDSLGFPDLCFFEPQHLLIIRGNDIEIISDTPQQVLQFIEQQEFKSETPIQKVNIQSRFSKSGYIDTVNKVKGDIKRGDIYVTNFCQEFFAEHAEIDPLAIFLKLNEVSPNPFASYFKWNHRYVLCASPERFLAKRGNELISQPIKGTAKRGDSGPEDELNKQQLRNHTKELQENVMIVDLVRNDLTRSAKQGTVKTEELYGIYSFKHLHQMISTVVCELQDGISAVQAIKNSFPMGSMTGAPKINAMQLMERYEHSKRGVYSGRWGILVPMMILILMW